MKHLLMTSTFLDFSNRKFGKMKRQNIALANMR